MRRPDLKKRTRSNLDQTKLRCVEFFKLKPGAAITQGDAKDFRRWLVEKKYSPATVSGSVNKTRQLFNHAIDHRLLSVNPFRKVGGGSQVIEERRFFVSREAIGRVMEKAPIDEWKLLIALGLYGGLRIRPIFELIHDQRSSGTGAQCFAFWHCRELTPS